MNLSIPPPKSDLLMDRKHILRQIKILALTGSLFLSSSPLVSAAPAKTEDKKGAEQADKSSKKADEKKPEEKKPEDKKEAKAAPEPVIDNVVSVQAEDLVKSPSDYLNKNIRFTANFYAFSNVALDYKPALRPAKDFFSFLIFRKDSRVPLSELKLAMKMPADEKSPISKLLSGLKEKDEVEVTGKVFSVALDEPWVDVLRIKRLKAAEDEKKADEKKGSESQDVKKPEEKNK